MTERIELEYDSLPSLLPLYVRGVARLSDRLAAGDTIAPIRACVADVQARPAHLARYRDVCGFADADTLPGTYPHVWALPLQMAVMTHKRFPLKLLGLVHVRNEIVQHRPAEVHESFELLVHVQGHRDARAGLEFDLVTTLRDDAGAKVWEEISTMLSRRQRGERGRRARRAPDAPLPDHAHRVRWDVPANIGRRYARVAGDYNPIHLSAASARLFGFRQAIATGMWLKARVAAELEPQLAASGYRLQVAFRKPVPLPGVVSLGYGLGAQGADFALMDASGQVVHLQGQVSYL